MYIKIHGTGDSKVVAICDESLIGKKLSNKDIGIEVTEMFYKGKKINTKELKKIIKNEKNVNLIGKETVTCAIEENILNTDNIIWFGDIPHTIIMEIKNDEA